MLCREMWKANLSSETIRSLFRRKPPTSSSSSSATTTAVAPSPPSTSASSPHVSSENEKEDGEEEDEQNENEKEEREEREEKEDEKNTIESKLSKLPKVGSSVAYKKGEKHGLTPIQVDRKIQELTKCIQNGKSPSKCKSCKQLKAYMYHSFSKRGGTKQLYCCGHCFDHWSDFFCAEEDYDFLSG